MMTQSTLFAVLTPAVPGAEARLLTPDQSAALHAAPESFLSVMSQVRCDGFSKLSGEAKTLDSNASLAETPEPPADPSGKAADIDAAMSSTLMAVMAQPRIAAGEFHKSTSTLAANFKNAPAGQGGEARPFRATSDRDTSLTDTPKPLANLPGKAPRIAAGEFHKPATTQAVNLKIAPTIQRGNAKSITETPDIDASPTEMPEPLAKPPGKAPRIAAREPQKSASTRAATFRNASVIQGDKARSLTETSESDASPIETPKPLAKPPGKALRTAADKFHNPATTQTVNLKIAPAIQGGQATPLTETSDSGASLPETPEPPANTSGKAGDIDASMSSALMAVMAQPRTTAGEFQKSASTQAAYSKNVPIGQGGQARPLTGIADKDVFPTETPKPPANPAGNAPQIAAGEYHKPATTQAVNLKTASAIQGGETKPLTGTSDSDASLTETPKSFVDPPGAAADLDASVAGTLMAMVAQPQIAAGGFREPASSRAMNLKIAPASQEGQTRPLIESSDSDEFPAETPEPLVRPSDKAADLDASVSSKFTAVEDQPQIAAGEIHKPASTEAVIFKIASDHAAAPVVLPSSSDSKPESTGPVQRSIDPPPKETSTSTTEPAARPAEPAGFPQQPVAAQIAITPPVAFVSADPVDGTGGALSSQRMKFGTEKNEIAGPTTQKVPTASIKEDLSTKSANNLMIESDSDHSGHKQDSIDSTLVVNWPVKASAGNVEVDKGTEAAQTVDHSATQAERVGHLVNQQVVMIRQSGANNIAVSLKLDPHTELSLQLMNHNGQIEAAVRLERGAVAGLENHWKDLQESLARQNVQLLPLENRASPRPPASNSASDTVSASLFNQSSQNPQRQSREARRDVPPVATVKTVPVTNKATTRTVSRQGWESWA